MSKKRKNFAWSVYKSFANVKSKVYALHPDGGEKDGVNFYADIASVPEKPDACIVCADLKNNEKLLSDLFGSGIGKIWLQQGSYNKDVLEEIRKRDIDPLTGCVLMYLPETSLIHRIHRFFHELFTKGRD
jgi:predicted CoA-binding protein